MLFFSVLPNVLAKVLQKISLFWCMTWSDQLLFVQVFAFLGFARLVIIAVPFPTLANYFGQRMVESPQQVDKDQLKIAAKVGKIIRIASPYTPWKSNCFPQALTAKYLLNRQGIASTLYFGANFKAEGEMVAHAWLRCGSLFVTGGAGHKTFGTVAYFS